MERNVIGQLDKLYAHVMDHEGSAVMHALHSGAQSLRQVVDTHGEAVDPLQVDIASMHEIKSRLGLEESEAFFELKVLPPHVYDENNPDHVTSRFLMVNARSSFQREKPSNPSPAYRVRAYFLLLGEEGYRRMRHDNIFPQFVVTEFCDQERVQSRASYLFHANPLGNYPLGGAAVAPRLVREEAPYGYMAQEMALAEVVLTQGPNFRG